MRTATEDRLHQDLRFAASAPSRRALAAGLEAGAWAGWLSGSGPTVALLCDPSDAERLGGRSGRREPPDGHAMVLPVDTDRCHRRGPLTQTARWPLRSSAREDERFVGERPRQRAAGWRWLGW